VRRLLLFCCAVVLVDTIFFSALTPLLPGLEEEFALGKTGAGILSAAYALGAAAGAIPAGVLASRLGVRPIVLAGLVTVALTSAGFGFADTIWLLDAMRFLQGLGSAFAWTGALAWLVARSPRERRGEMIGLAMGAAIGGAILGPVLGGAAAVVGRGPAFLGVGALEVALAVWALSLTSPGPGSRQDARTLLAALRHPTLATGVVFVLMPGLLFGCMGVLSPLALDRLGWSAVQISVLFLVTAAIEAVIAPFIGRLSDRRGPYLVIRLALVWSAVAMLVLPWPREAWFLAAVVALASFAFGAFFVPGTTVMTHGAEAAGLDHALALSLVNLAWAPGQVIGSAAGGALADATSDAVPYLGLAALCVLGLVFVARRAAVRPAVA
jgi:predicted MFS family arabinose efflux permease